MPTPRAIVELAEFDPRLAAALNQYVAEHGEDTPVLAATAMGTAFVSTFASIPNDLVRAILARCEELLESGSDIIQAAITTGFLESIQFAADRSEFDFTRLNPLLGTRARQAMLHNDAAYGCRTPGLTRT